MSALSELGLRPGATLCEARDAYRALAKRTHPDRGGDAAAFKRATEAWEAIKADPSLLGPGGNTWSHMDAVPMDPGPMDPTEKRDLFESILVMIDTGQAGVPGTYTIAGNTYTMRNGEWVRTHLMRNGERVSA